MAPSISNQTKSSRTTDRLLSDLASYADALFHGAIYEQYAAICYRRNRELGTTEVLVVTSRESGRWVVPKGWPIKGKKPYEVASIEAFEEAGVSGKIKKKPFGYFTYLKQLAEGNRVPCIVQLHLLEVEKTYENFPERDQRRSEWVSFTEAASRVREPELKGLLLTAEQKLRRSKGKK
ncbi:NUDIX hydrolase [Rhizobium leucaenae]|uniref:8-oxo-dGTP pyrophosphatase MutT (NUDIX family) n=1 Tax=Rhizobium leucaenae TaxID=29450 RepID=A0A7W6ZRF2_9HYPH|nr:NUDIX hydrolase [Rhizobium leucaenae]MBB4567244.1 8-oxo-dGTP pyrophosphatase MutT (NUDIX family) [Rhizobium leucaenae]MBB6304277.1 8-oxo-dGTP pyrophosphatase MutT (NUDIX family) [Rhizobium leucaenae]